MRAPGVDNWLGFVDMTGNSPVPYFYVTDHLGSVLAVTDANGNLVERYEYDAWGKVLSVTDANGNALTRSAFGNRILWQAREYSLLLPQPLVRPDHREMDQQGPDWD